MGWVSCLEDVEKRFNEASTYLAHYSLPSTHSIGEPLPPLPKPGEWQSLRQQINSLLDKLKVEILELEKRQYDLLDVLTNPNAELLDKWYKSHEEKIKLKRQKAELKQQNDELKREVLLLQYRLKEAGLWQASYSSRLAGTVKNPNPVSPTLKYSTAPSGEITALELAMQKAQIFKEQYE